MSKKYLWVCDYCGEEYEISSSQLNRLKSGKQKSAFCSKECKALSQKRKVIVKCSCCGKDIEKTEYQASVHENYFCSKKCNAKYLHDTTTEERICEICGKPYETKKVSPQRFCTPNCANEYQKTRTGRLSPNFKGIEVECEWCKKSFDIPPYREKISERHFCCKQCQRDWYAKVHSQTLDFRQKVRERAVEQLCSGMFSDTDTKPQLIVNSMLDELCLSYEREYNIKYYAIDNYLIDSGLMIEVQGDYFHSNPKKYLDENNLNSMQLQRIGKDKAKHTYIKNYYNIEVLYLWENDIVKSPDLCKKLIQEYVDNNGNLANYHSFNYETNGDNIVLSLSPILAFQDR